MQCKCEQHLHERHILRTPHLIYNPCGGIPYLNTEGISPSYTVTGLWDDSKLKQNNICTAFAEETEK